MVEFATTTFISSHCANSGQRAPHFHVSLLPIHHFCHFFYSISFATFDIPLFVPLLPFLPYFPFLPFLPILPFLWKNQFPTPRWQHFSQGITIICNNGNNWNRLASIGNNGQQLAIGHRLLLAMYNEKMMVLVSVYRVFHVGMLLRAGQTVCSIRRGSERDATGVVGNDSFGQSLAHPASSVATPMILCRIFWNVLDAVMLLHACHTPLSSEHTTFISYPMISCCCGYWCGGVTMEHWHEM